MCDNRTRAAGSAGPACSAWVWCRDCHGAHRIFGDPLADLQTLLKPITATRDMIRRIVTDPPMPNIRISDKCGL